MEQSERLTILARHVASLVGDGETVGLGSGSTAEAVIRALGQRVQQGLRIEGVATSRRTARLAADIGIRLRSLEEVDQLDLGIDGADEIDPHLNLVKGRGGALLHEKLVARACKRFLVVAAAEKLVERLGTRMPLPVEVVPFGWKQTATEIRRLGLHPDLRLAATGTAVSDPNPFRSDGGHYLLDCMAGPIDDPTLLANRIKAITGVVDHGIFAGIATHGVIVDLDGSVRTIGEAT